MAKLKGLKCRECKREYPIEPIHVCEFCFGPLEANYDYDYIKSTINKENISKRPEKFMEIHRFTTCRKSNRWSNRWFYAS